MIKLYNKTTNAYHSFQTTIFPDKTSQLWKIDPGPEKGHSFDVIWMFEDESEYARVLQLGALLSDTTTRPRLYAPYLPYARQDKAVFFKDGGIIREVTLDEVRKNVEATYWGYRAAGGEF